MEWAANAVRVDDVDGLIDMGVEPRAVADYFTRALARMVFHGAFVHLDPHEGTWMSDPFRGIVEPSS